MNKLPWFVSLEELEAKPTRWLKAQHGLYRGVRIGLSHYNYNSERTDLTMLLKYVNILKDILNTRENILNKKERKILRQEKARKKYR